MKRVLFVFSLFSLLVVAAAACRERVPLPPSANVSLILEPSPARAGEDVNLGVSISALDLNPVEDARVTISGSLPGEPAQFTLEAKEELQGVYVLQDFSFPKNGSWDVDVTIDFPNGSQFSRRFTALVLE